MIANVFGCHKISTRHESAIGFAMLSFEQRNGHERSLPKKFVSNQTKIKSEDRVLEFVSKNAGCTRADIVAVTKMHENTVANVLSQCIRSKRVQTKRDKKIGNLLYSRYWISDGKEQA